MFGYSNSEVRGLMHFKVVLAFARKIFVIKQSCCGWWEKSTASLQNTYLVNRIWESEFVSTCLYLTEKLRWHQTLVFILSFSFSKWGILGSCYVYRKHIQDRNNWNYLGVVVKLVCTPHFLLPVYEKV